ncbi:Ig-like domain-containing protein [Nocardioides antri]|uniref:Ig-like domain-containing protein n=1 Tax=Nocardioides antri TaxID=2607659 RepID=UPI00165F2019|nr:Ig-like domain-containing protein [Nocardioides antri]
MGFTKQARRGLAVVAAGGLGAGLLVGSGVAPASAAATLTLDYTCTYPLINQQDLTVDITVDLPAEAEVGVPTAPFDIEAVSTVSATTTSGLALIGAKTIEGTAISHVNVQAPQVNLPDVQVPVTIPQTPVPASGAFDIPATGQTPSLTFPQVGQGTIDIGNLDLRMIARNSSGEPIALPGGHPDGSFDAPCTVEPGQDQRLATFPIVGDPGSNTAPDATDVAGTTTASKSVVLTLAGSDADGDPLTYAAADGANGSVSLAGDVATYTPDDGFVGTDTFTYTVSDGVAEASASVTVEVAKAPTTTKATPARKRAKIGKPIKVKVVTTAPALTPTGKVTIKRKGKVVAKGTLSEGQAVLTIPRKVTKRLKRGKATFDVKYAGSAVATPSAAELTVKMVR